MQSVGLDYQSATPQHDAGKTPARPRYPVFIYYYYYHHHHHHHHHYLANAVNSISDDSDICGARILTNNLI
jgi:hypothetical protein